MRTADASITLWELENPSMWAQIVELAIVWMLYTVMCELGCSIRVMGYSQL